MSGGRDNRPQVFVERRVLHNSRTRRILGKLQDPRVEIIDNLADVAKSLDDRLTGTSRTLALAHFRGNFLKKCPGTQKHICCGYKVLNIQTGCDLGCTYCILQGYLNNPLLTVYVNLEDALEQVEAELATHPDKFYRIGTGELTDSLFLDQLTGISRELVKFFARQRNAVLELKTKTDQIDHLLDVDPRGKVILSWSLNPSGVVKREEGKSAPLEARLAAAKKAAQAGYHLGFHFDPLIHHPGWVDSYREAVDAIFDHVDASRIVWISLGALRYPPHLGRIIRERHPRSDLPLGELFPGTDGKFRYLRHIRVHMFRTVYERIRRHSRDVFVYLCMESDLVWRESFGWSPRSTRRLAKLMDERARGFTS